ncbi:MAG: CBS domain-containing protein [Parvibaculales bacterium]
MNVKAILDDKGAGILTIDGNRLLSDAVTVFEKESVGALVVTFPDQPLAGMLSERDLVRALYAKGGSALDEKISSYMSENVITISPETTIVEAMEIMTEKRVRHIPVLQKGSLAGLVSIGDVVKKRISLSEAEAEALKNYIVSG